MKLVRALVVVSMMLALAAPFAAAAESPVLLPNIPYVFAMEMATPQIDGDLSDWAKSGALAFPISIGKVHTAEVIDWAGEDDLSGKAYVGWNEQGFYFAAEVKDDVQRNLFQEVNMWQGDCVQFSIDGAFNRKPYYDGDDYEYGLALTPVGAQVQRWKAAGSKPTGLVKEATVAIVRDEAAKVTRYEVALPASEVEPVVLAGGTSVGFSWIINEDDGAGRAGWAEWTLGIGRTKDPSKYGQLVLLNVKR